MEKSIKCKPCCGGMVIHRFRASLNRKKAQNMGFKGKNGGIYGVIHGFIHIIHRNCEKFKNNIHIIIYIL